MRVVWNTQFMDAFQDCLKYTPLSRLQTIREKDEKPVIEIKNAKYETSVEVYSRRSRRFTG